MGAWTPERSGSAVLMSQGPSTVTAMPAMQWLLSATESVTSGQPGEHADQTSGPELLTLHGDGCP